MGQMAGPRRIRRQTEQGAAVEKMVQRIHEIVEVLA
jgi:hypothetical protein